MQVKDKDNGELCTWFDKLEFFFPLQKNYLSLSPLPLKEEISLYQKLWDLLD